MDDETKKIIEDLKSKVDKLTSDLEASNRILAEHTHSGNDGSTYIYQDDVKQRTGRTFKIGNFQFTDLPTTPTAAGTEFGFMVVGSDELIQDGSDTAQLTIEHQPFTNGDTNQTFFYGFRGKLYVGQKGKVKEGENKFYQKEYEFEPDALVGLRINFDNTEGITESYLITENTKDTITIDGNWSFSLDSAPFIIFIPMYLGAAEYPWRRIYTGDGSSGGVRFGYGSTNQGQNGLLYMDDAGDLYWRDKSGTSTQLN